MSPKVFITGATGYIGGDALVEIQQAHPDWELTTLVRNEAGGAKITAMFPHIRIVLGDLDSTELLEEESANADIIYHFADADHPPSAQAITNGLKRRTSDKPGFLIHTSGAGILGFKTLRGNRWGEDEDKVYDDWEGIAELTNMPDDALHRNVEKIVLAASEGRPELIKTAIVSPPTIYGHGRGPGNKRSIQVNSAISTFLTEKEAFSVGRGQNVWHGIYVQDLSKLYLLLGEAAVNGGPSALWNETGYYLSEDGHFVWKDVFEAIAREAHSNGWLPSAEVKERSYEEVSKVDKWYAYKLGTTARGVSKRAGELLGWKPTGPKIFEQIPELVRSEAKDLGLC